MTTKQTLMSDIAIPPGEFLSEILEEYGMSQQDLARRMARPPQAINEIVKGHKAITPETAIQLEQVVGVPSHVWTGLESEYRLIKAKQKEAKGIQKEVALLADFPYDSLCKLGLVATSRIVTERVAELRKFFGVSSLYNLHDVEKYNPAFRLSNKNEISKEAIVSWLRTGSLLSRNINTHAYSKKALTQLLPSIRSLSLEHDPQIFLRTLRDILATAGVALVVIPHFPKTYVTGATFWERKDKAVVMMSLRGSWGDIFWFSLFHELGHIILHDKRSVFIEGKVIDETHEQQEKEADDFASHCLVPADEYSKFTAKNNFSQVCIETFSRHVGIHAGIVTGRLQHDELLSYTRNICRVRYKWR